MCDNSTCLRQGLTRAPASGVLAAPCIVTLLRPLPIVGGGGAEASPGISGSGLPAFPGTGRRHHLQLLSRADWIMVLTSKCLIGAQVKWGILITAYMFSSFAQGISSLVPLFGITKAMES